MQTDAGNACGNVDVFETGAIGEYLSADAGALALFSKGYGFKSRATIERKLADTGNTCGNGDACQARATVERRRADTDNTCGNGDACKARATVERRRADTDNTCGNGDACKA